MTVDTIPAQSTAVGAPTLPMTFDVTPAAANAGALISGSLALLDGSYQLAQTLCQTNFAPPHFRGKPEETAVAVMYGAQLGLDPLQALQNITVISGRPGLYARTMHALVLRAGHRVTVAESGPERVVVTGQRKGSPDVETVEWTPEKAKRAGYFTNKKYDTDPEAMLRARALADVCRLVAPDVLLGLAYVAEELELIEDPADVTPLPKAKRRESAADLLGETQTVAVQTYADKGEPQTEPGAPAQTEPEQATEPAITGKQRTAIYAGMSALGYDSDQAKTVVAAMVDHPIGSMNDLTRDEAKTVLDAIAEKQAEAERAAAEEPVDQWDTTQAQQ